MFEKLVSIRLSNFLRKNKIISSKQFGFCKGKSTTDALEYLTNYIYSNLNSNKKVIVTSLDLKKAFDTVNHSRLLYKLHNYGIRGKANDLLKSYLSHRKQRVRLGKATSDYLNVNLGVPQGSILGPLLFVVYINDLLNFSCISYADDTAALCAADSWIEVIRLMEDLMDEMYEWLKQNSLSLNLTKTQLITFGPYCDSVPINVRVQVGGVILTRAVVIKYLGVYFDQNLKWDYHINYLLKRTKYLIHVFYKLKNLLDKNNLLAIYYALMHSTLTYGIISWGGAYYNNIDKITRVQKKALKIMKCRSGVLSVPQVF